MVLNKSLDNELIIHAYIHPMLKKCKIIFENIPLGYPPIFHKIRGRSQTNHKTPYRHPHKYKEEIEKTINELLEMGHIQPSSTKFASSIIIIKIKD